MGQKSQDLLDIFEAARLTGLSEGSLRIYSKKAPAWGPTAPFVTGHNPGKGPSKVRLYPRQALLEWIALRDKYHAKRRADREKGRDVYESLTSMLTEAKATIEEKDKTIAKLQRLLDKSRDSTKDLKEQVAEAQAAAHEARNASAFLGKTVDKITDAKRSAIHRLKEKVKAAEAETIRTRDAAAFVTKTREQNEELYKKALLQLKDKADAAEARADKAEAKAAAAEERAAAAEAALRDQAKPSTPPKPRTPGRGRGQRSAMKTNSK